MKGRRWSPPSLVLPSREEEPWNSQLQLRFLATSAAQCHRQPPWEVVDPVPRLISPFSTTNLRQVVVRGNDGVFLVGKMGKRYSKVGVVWEASGLGRVRWNDQRGGVVGNV
ncbi:hypothetical protein TorRG33x02_315760 [Trema orientale]|uniref:Uncharacterized protein n=1 Tax=Trema orientale TaxID=63057 RepID=A0A2P5BMP3_TREOI|nr:hypothetical protein TorRG33x02_315760 [Trema orientale]